MPKDFSIRLSFRMTLVCTQSQFGLEFPIDWLNGMITNDKCCCTRWGQLQLSWGRRPLRLRHGADPEPR